MGEAWTGRDFFRRRKLALPATLRRPTTPVLRGRADTGKLATAGGVAGLINGIPQFALRLILFAGPDDMAFVARLAEALKDAIVRRNTEHKVPRRENPGLGEHDGIFDG